MEERSEIQRRPQGQSYRLNVIQIPLLRGFGSVILCSYVLLYDLLITPPFSWSRYLAFVAIFATYSVGSWLVLRAGYRKVKPLDLSLLFLIIDLFFWLLVIYRTGAEKSLLFFLSVVRVSDQAYTSFKRTLMFAHLTLASYVVFVIYLAAIEGRAIDWRIEILKMAYIYARRAARSLRGEGTLSGFVAKGGGSIVLLAGRVWYVLSERCIDVVENCFNFTIKSDEHEPLRVYQLEYF